MTSSNAPARDAAIRRGFGLRFLRALRLDAGVFDEVEGDSRALLHASCVVLGAGLARWIFDLSTGSGPGVMASLAGAVVLWLLSTALLTSVGVGWLHGTSDPREMFRTLGFAAAPLWLLAPAYLLEGRAHIVAGVALHAWALAAGVVAVRQALDVSTARALAACALSFGLGVALLVVLGVPWS